MKLIKQFTGCTTYYGNSSYFILYQDNKYCYKVEVDKKSECYREGLKEYSIYENKVTAYSSTYNIINIKKYRKNAVIKNYKTLPLFQNIGLEWEFNNKFCKYKYVLGGDVELYKELTPPFNYLKEENYIIWEAITEPLSIHNIKLLLGVGYKMALSGALKEQEGEYDHLAGSMHTHIDIHNLGLQNHSFLYKKLQFVKDLKNKNTLFFKRALNTEFRTGLTGGSGSSVFHYFYEDLNSKGSKLTINSKKGKRTTLEFRINENPYPLWVFLLPSIFFTDKEEYDLEYSLQYWKRFLKRDNYKILKRVLPVYFGINGDGEAFTEWLENNPSVMDLDW